MNRREFLKKGAAALAAGGLLAPSLAGAARPPERRMTMDLRPGSIGVRGRLPEIVDLAHRYGFESVAPDAGYLAELSDEALDEFLGDLKAKRLVWGAAGLPVDFRRDDERFEADLEALPGVAKALSRAGVTRIGTWIMPRHETLTYVRNFRQHARRLRRVARVLASHRLRLGLEYVGPKTSWASSRHTFVHTLAETKDLIAEIDVPGSVGLVLDSWHWYTAHETVGDLRALKADEVVAVDLNDAPRGIEIDAQVDSRRELPAATGVIDLAGFLGALVEIGYDGPVRAEPFNRELNRLADEEAVATTAKAMKRAFALIR